MPTMRSLSLACFLLLMLVATGFISILSRAWGQQSTSETFITAYTEPSKRLKLAFTGLGVIQEVMVKEGDAVQTDQVLIAQDQEVEALELERLKAEAESNSRVEAAAADLGVKKKVYERKSQAAPGTYNQAELEEAELEVTFRTKQLEIANLESSQN